MSAYLEQSVGSARLCSLLRQSVYYALHQLPIETFVAHEKIRRSVLDDSAGLQDNDTIEGLDGRKPVRDGDHGTPSHQPR